MEWLREIFFFWGGSDSITQDGDLQAESSVDGGDFWITAPFSSQRKFDLLFTTY